MLNRPTNLDTALHVTAWSRKLRQQVTSWDCYTALSGVLSTNQKQTPPNAIYLQLDAKEVNTGARYAIVPLVLNLSGAPREGTAQNQLGWEEAIRYKHFRAYYNDLSHAVNLNNYGIEAITKEYYGELSEITPKLALYAQELVGKYIREAHVMRYANNLTVAPHNLIQELNPNIAVCGLAPAQWPAFNMAPATYTNNVVTAMLASAAAGTNPVAAACSVRYLQAVNEWTASHNGRLLKPITLDGKERLMIVLPTPQCRWLKDPGANPNNTGAIIRDMAAYPEIKHFFPGAFGIMDERLVLVEDPRYVTVVVSGTAGNFSLTPGYKWPGEDAWSDTRDHTLAAWQVGAVLGQAGFCDWNPEPWHYRYEYEEYDKFGGKAIRCSRGIQLVEYDYGTVPSTPTNLTRYHDGTAMLLMKQPPNVT